jgi:hypothetical protein
MKKLLLLSSVLLFSLAATCEPEPIEETNPLDCNCGIVIEKTYYNIPNNSFTLIKVKNDCSQEVTTYNLVGNQGTLNEKYCNE